jgi:putative membrane protein
MMNNGFGMGYGMGFGFIFQLLIFVLFFLIVWWLIRSVPTMGIAKSEKPLDILKRRLAKGEITRKEYEELKKEVEERN